MFTAVAEGSPFELTKSSIVCHDGGGMKEGVGCRPLRAVNVVVVVVTGQVFRASLTLDNAEGCVVDATPQRSLDVESVVLRTYRRVFLCICFEC